MFTAFPSARSAAAALTAVLLACGSVSAQKNPSSDDPPEKGLQVQERGPLHEGFARPLDKSVGPTPVVPKKPPGPIPEQPPQERPQGDNVQWVPGYWAWDIEKNDYLWVSGFWRNVPPDRKWVPGYWAEKDGAYQWVPGFWANEKTENLEFLPKPPDSLEIGPSAPAPDDSSFYIPGEWVHRGRQYAWRPGFWYPTYDGWVWNPGYYTWTPAGVVYVDGYWDYPLETRGVLFAPVYFSEPLWDVPGWYYRPRWVLGIGGLYGSLFVWPDYCHYYFGNYSGPFYSGIGFHTWHGWGRHFHDPLFNYYSWHNRNNPNWAGGLQNGFIARQGGAGGRAGPTGQLHAASGARPTAAQQRLVTPLSQANVRNVHLSPAPVPQVTQQQAARIAAANSRGPGGGQARATTAPVIDSARRSLYYGTPGNELHYSTRGLDSRMLDLGPGYQGRNYITPGSLPGGGHAGAPAHMYAPHGGGGPVYHGGGPVSHGGGAMPRGGGGGGAMPHSGGGGGAPRGGHGGRGH